MEKIIIDEDELERMFYRYLRDVGCISVSYTLPKAEFEKVFNEWVGDMEALGLLTWSPPDLSHIVEVTNVN
jgi:hypothetical protein